MSNLRDRYVRWRFKKALCEHDCPKDSRIFVSDQCLFCGEPHGDHLTKWCPELTRREVKKIIHLMTEFTNEELARMYKAERDYDRALAQKSSDKGGVVPAATGVAPTEAADVFASVSAP